MQYTNPDLKFNSVPPSGEIGWKSPSNIALIKYWGKKGNQIPQNPSLSFSLNKAHTQTTVQYRPAKGNKFSVDFLLNGKTNAAFGEKTTSFFKSLSEVFPFIRQLDFTIHSENTFPHSAGIASSASGMSALALTLCDLERTYFHQINDIDFFQKASFLARLGSGSACRSVYGGYTIWGETQAQNNTTNLYAVPVKGKVHPEFQHFQDTILLVETGAKKVSSRAGHALMNNHPFATERFGQARENLKILLTALQSGDLETFIRITESEALTLHAMMMTSNPSFLLMKPETLQIISKIQEFRMSTGTPVCFTLDAGPNVHMLYPLSAKELVHDFLNQELSKHTGNRGWIEDELGEGPQKITS
ncbi:MAG: diphosphomevalonate decarboxylase [Bacteroidales bacterium]|nr:diphosphomevalonate decarboxylase [Bacteroidales bacterium]